MSKYYEKRSSKARKLRLNEEMRELVPEISEVKIRNGKALLYNGKAEPFKVPYANDDPIGTNNALKQILIGELGHPEIIACQWCDHLADLMAEPPSEDEEEEKKPLYLMKYTKGIPYGIPAAESIILGGAKPMWLQIIDGKAVLNKEILPPDGRPVQPCEIGTVQSKEYEFSSEEEINNYIFRAKKENLDTLFKRSKSFWEKYIDADNYHHVIGAADTIFSYNVDRSASTHYLLFIGDNETGKSNNLTLFEHLAYRPLYSSILTAANIFRSSGSYEEAQVTILEDQIDNIENQPIEKRQTYEIGYKPGGKVLRNDDTPSGRKSQAYLAYGFKAFTSEKQPDSIACKAFNERVFVIKCFPGDPEYDISEVQPGDDEYKPQLEDLVDFRKLLLVYRLLHFNDLMPNIKGLTLKRRDKQLCKPLIRFFQGTKAVDEIAASLWILLKEKKDRKAETIEAAIHKILSNLIASGKAQKTTLDDDEVVLTNADIEIAVRTDLKAKDIQGKSQTWETEDYGALSKSKITSTVKDRFGGDSYRNETVRGVRLSKKILEKLGKNYSSINGIKWDRSPVETTKISGHPDTPDTPDTSTEGVTNVETENVGKTSNNCNIPSEDIQQTPGDNENISNQTSTKESEPSYKVSEVSERQDQTSTEPSQQATTLPSFGIDNPLPKNVASDTTSSTQESSEPKSSQPSQDGDANEKPMFHKLPEMPEAYEGDLDVVREKDLESQESSKDSINPIISVEDFFRNDMPLPGHSITLSPCYHIIGSKQDEMGFETKYYCKLHPELGSTLLSEVENHCRQEDAESHKAAILSKAGLPETGDTTT